MATHRVESHAEELAFEASCPIQRETVPVGARVVGRRSRATRIRVADGAFGGDPGRLPPVGS